MSEIMQWDNFIDVRLTLLVGSIVIGLPLSLLMYGGRLLWMLFREKKENWMLFREQKENLPRHLTARKR